MTPNKIVISDSQFHISYNNTDYAIYGSDTTAIVVNQTKFYILMGDHTKEYKQCQTLDSCLDYYKKNINLSHKYSDKL